MTDQFDQELDILGDLLTTVENTSDEDYVKELISPRHCDAAMRDLVELRKVTKKIISECEGDSRETDRYNMHQRSLKCINREIRLVSDRKSSFKGDNHGNRS